MCIKMYIRFGTMVTRAKGRKGKIVSRRETNYKSKGLDCYEKAAELGDPFGYECIARAYYTGTAGGVNYQKAFEYYTISDEFHSSEKYYYLGEMYFHGYYVQKDREKAKEYYEQLVNDEVYSNTDNQYVSLARRRLLEMEE